MEKKKQPAVLLSAVYKTKKHKKKTQKRKISSLIFYKNNKYSFDTEQILKKREYLYKKVITMVQTDQIKDLMNRLGALRRYL